MTDTKQNLPVVMPFGRLKGVVEKSDCNFAHSHIDKFDLMAVAVRESMGTSIVCGPCGGFNQNFNVLIAATGVNRQEFTECIRIRGGSQNNGLIKFRFEPSWFELVKHDRSLSHLTPAWQAFWSCSIGLGQQSVYYLMDLLDKKPPFDYLERFKSDEAMQVRQMFYVLEKLAIMSPNDLALAFTRYNSGPGAKHISDYGTKVFSLARDLRKAYGGA